ILHEPTVRARQAAAEGNLEQYEAALQTIYGLEVTPNAQQDNKSSYSKAYTEQLDSTNRRSSIITRHSDRRRTAQIGSLSVDTNNAGSPNATRPAPCTTHQCGLRCVRSSRFRTDDHG